MVTKTCSQRSANMAAPPLLHGWVVLITWDIMSGAGNYDALYEITTLPPDSR